jgi:hypothetical protein
MWNVILQLQILEMVADDDLQKRLFLGKQPSTE